MRRRDREKIEQAKQGISIGTRYILNLSYGLLKQIEETISRFEKEGKKVYGVMLVENAEFMVDCESLGVRQQIIIKKSEVLDVKGKRV